VRNDRARRAPAPGQVHPAKHFFYASGWKKFEPLWDLMIRARQLNHITPLLETLLSRVTGTSPKEPEDVSVTGALPMRQIS
jgi:hypothetical protein